MVQNSLRLMFFSPFSAIEAHSVPETVLMEALQQRGHTVYAVRCGGSLEPVCQVIEMYQQSGSLSPKQACSRCQKNRLKLSTISGEVTLDLEDFVREDELKLAWRALENTPNHELPEFVFEDVPVGRYSMYDTVLKFKEHELPLSLPASIHLRALIRKGLSVLLAANTLIKRFSPDRVITYNAKYSLNRVFCAVAEKADVPWFTIHAGTDFNRRLEKMEIFQGIVPQALLASDPRLTEVLRTPSSQAGVLSVAPHVDSIFRAKQVWTYSSPGGSCSSSKILEQFSITTGMHIILAIGRSRDERVADQWTGSHPFEHARLFDDEYDWVTNLIRMANENPETFILYRPHPRRFPNRRELKTDSSVHELLGHVSSRNPPDNFRVNLPDDQVSVFDLMRVADVVANSTSSVGLEALLLGIPVVGNGDPLYAYPRSLHTEPIDKSNYFDLLKHTGRADLTDQVNRITRAVRWLDFRLNRAEVDLSPVVSERQLSLPSPIENRMNQILAASLQNTRLRVSKKNRLIPWKLVPLNYRQPQEQLSPELTKSLTWSIENLSGWPFRAEFQDDDRASEVLERSALGVAFAQYSSSLEVADDKLFERYRNAIIEALRQ